MMQDLGVETELAGWGKKMGMEADQLADVFGNYGGQIIEPQFAGHAAHSFKGVDVAADESLRDFGYG